MTFNVISYQMISEQKSTVSEHFFSDMCDTSKLVFYNNPICLSLNKITMRKIALLLSIIINFLVFGQAGIADNDFNPQITGSYGLTIRVTR